MVLVKEERVRGSVIKFEFTHTSKKLGKITLTEQAISAENAKKKIFKALSQKYKALKKQNKRV